MKCPECGSEDITECPVCDICSYNKCYSCGAETLKERAK